MIVCGELLRHVRYLQQKSLTNVLLWTFVPFTCAQDPPTGIVDILSYSRYAVHIIVIMPSSHDICNAGLDTGFRLAPLLSNCDREHAAAMT